VADSTNIDGTLTHFDQKLVHCLGGGWVRTRRAVHPFHTGLHPGLLLRRHLVDRPGVQATSVSRRDAGKDSVGSWLDRSLEPATCAGKGRARSPKLQVLLPSSRLAIAGENTDEGSLTVALRGRDEI